MKVRVLVCTVLLLLIGAPPAHAYLDPGTGSMLLSALVGLAATCLFLLKDFWYNAVSFMYRVCGKNAPLDKRETLVFYSEGKQNWSTFQPILEALAQRQVAATYLTSDKQDPGLALLPPHRAQYIGTGNRAYTFLNMLEADVVGMTTPNLDVLQIRRSQRVRHYTHIVHAVTDIALYKLFSCDYFDSVLCSGSHQIRTLRTLEQLRGTKPKLLLESGCPYMDVLAAQAAEREEPSAALEVPAHARLAPPRGGHQRCILVAPTWGQNGLLSRFGMSLLKPLAVQGHTVLIRPHPQSFVNESSLLKSLEKALENHTNVRWDREASPVRSLRAADILVSDISGIVFDCAFVFLKPVITLSFVPDIRGTDAFDLTEPVWEYQVLDQLGKRINVEDVPHLPEIITSLLDKEEFTKRIQDLRSASVYNYANCAGIIAEQIIQIQQTIVKNNNAH